MPHTTTFDPRQFMMDNAFEAFYYQTTNLKRVGSHQHGFYEIYLFESGNVTYVVGNKKYDLLPGDMLLLPPQEPHYPIFNLPDVTYSRLVLWISDLFIQNAKESCNCNFALPFDLASEHGIHLMRLEPAISNELFRIVYEMATREEETYARAQNNVALLSFFIRLNRLYADYTMQQKQKDPFSTHLIQIVDYIVNNFDQPITLEAVAEHCFLSKGYLSHGFKRTMGVTVRRYITMRRLFRARQMLLAGGKPNEVARRCGFEEYSTFFRSFKKEYGIAPKEMRSGSLSARA